MARAEFAFRARTVPRRRLLAEPRDHPIATDPALLAWLASEMDGELLDVVYSFFLQAKGHPFEAPRANIDLKELFEEIEEVHLAWLENLIDGVRCDTFLLGGREYWAGVHLCPSPGCACHKAEVNFFDEEPEKSGDTVGSVRLKFDGAEGFEVVTIAADCGAPDQLIKELWALFERRHNVGAYLRRRQAQAKAVGATLWRPVNQATLIGPKRGRNDPCPCGSGRKFKKCCLGKDITASVADASARNAR